MIRIILASTHARVCKERDEARREAKYWLGVASSRYERARDLRAQISSLTARLDARDRVVEALERQIADLTQPCVEGGRFGKKVRS